MVTWQQQSTKSSAKDVNLGTITDTLSWHKFSPLIGIPCQTKNFTGDAEESLQKASQKPKVVHTDNSWEFGKDCEELSWNHRTSTPHRSETNGIAARVVRRLKEGTSAVFELDDKWWSDSMECYCYPRNVQDFLADGKTLNEWRFGGSFLDMLCSRRETWEEDVLIAEIAELDKLDASEIYHRRLFITTKTENLYILWQIVQQHYQEETTNSKNPLWDGNTT